MTSVEIIEKFIEEVKEIMNKTEFDRDHAMVLRELIEDIDKTAVIPFLKTLYEEEGVFFKDYISKEEFDKHVYSLYKVLDVGRQFHIYYIEGEI